MLTFLFFFLLTFPQLILADNLLPVPATQNDNKDKDDTEAPETSKLLAIGNLAFPSSQQPTPLISFGQNLISEHQFEYEMIPSYRKGKRECFFDISNNLLYAFTDSLSIYLNLANAIQFKQGKYHSDGFEDLIVQIEYAPYTQEHYTYYDQLSIIGNVTIPTGSSTKKPVTGAGSNSFFIGSVLSRMSINWFYFSAYGGVFNTSNHRNKLGNRFLYQYGFGRRIYNNAEWLVAWMCECTGELAMRDTNQGITLPNSGGNLIFVTPSLFMSTKRHFVFQIGFGFPIVHQLHGHQNRKEYLIQSKTSWNF